MPASPLLTFAIPTYNRAKCLDQLLGALLHQFRGENRVELLVSDNASTDNTPAVVEAYKQQGLSIRYMRNPANQGPDFNILQCYRQAAGKYVWIFGDDDMIAPGALERVLKALSTQKYDLVCIRAYHFEGEYVQHKNFTSTSDLELTSVDDLARQINVFFTFISGIIVHKEYISSLPHRPFDSLLGTSLVQLGPIYATLNRHRRSLLIRDPLVAATSNSHVSYALYRVFGPNLTQITGEWVEKESVRRIIINGTIQTFFPFFILLTRRSETSSVHEDPHQVLRSCFHNNFRYWIFDYPIYALPLPLASAWTLMVKVVNKVDRAFGSHLASL